MSFNADERKIPKIVLKLGPKAEAPISIDDSSSKNDSIFSTKAAEFVKEHFPPSSLPNIPLQVLLKKLNQNTYRSIENILELMKRMNDIEKKKTLLQVLLRIRELYRKLLILTEWTKISNEHLALKAIISAAERSKANLHVLTTSITNNSMAFHSKMHVEPFFDFYQQFLISSANGLTTTPKYFAPSISSLAPPPTSTSKSMVDDESIWYQTLDSLLRLELSKHLHKFTRDCIRFESVELGKARIVCLNVFEIELTLVPPSFDTAADSTSSTGRTDAQWFILKVEVASLKDLYKNSLTGIFQTRHNSKMAPNSSTQYFDSILEDCEKYIELFYYEKIQSQFSFLSTKICGIQRPEPSSFKISPWFLTESISLTFTYKDGFQVSPVKYKEFFQPSLSFNENEAKDIFKSLFDTFYTNSQLNDFFENLLKSEIISSYCVLSENYYKIDFLSTEADDGTEGCLYILVDPFKTSIIQRFKVTISHIQSHTQVDKRNDSDYFTDLIQSVSDSISTFNSNLFEEVIIQLRTIAMASIISSQSHWTILNCPNITTKTTICIKQKERNRNNRNNNLNLKRDLKKFFISLQFLASNEISMKFLVLKPKFTNISMDFNFEEISISQSETSCKFKMRPFSFPVKNQNFTDSLCEILKSARVKLGEIEMKLRFMDSIEKLEIEGIFNENQNQNQKSFQILSLGLPQIVDSIYIISSVDTTKEMNVYMDIDDIEDVGNSNSKNGNDDSSMDDKGTLNTKTTTNNSYIGQFNLNFPSYSESKSKFIISPPTSVSDTDTYGDEYDDDLKQILVLIKNQLRLFTIFDHFQVINAAFIIKEFSLDPFKFIIASLPPQDREMELFVDPSSGNICVNTTGKEFIRQEEICCFINSDNFNTFDFVEMISEE